MVVKYQIDSWSFQAFPFLMECSAFKTQVFKILMFDTINFFQVHLSYMKDVFVHWLRIIILS